MGLCAYEHYWMVINFDHAMPLKVEMRLYQNITWQFFPFELFDCFQQWKTNCMNEHRPSMIAFIISILRSKIKQRADSTEKC